MLRQLIRIIDQLSAYGRVLRRMSWILVGLLIGSVALEFGIWTRTEILQGPFQIADDSSGRLIAPIGKDIFFLSLQSASKDDALARMRQTPLRFYVRENSLPDYKSSSGTIRQRALFGIGGLRQEILFTLPDGMKNDPNAYLSVDYRVRLHRTAFDLIKRGTAATLLLWILVAYRSCNHIPPAVVRRFFPWLVLIFPIAGWLLIAACGIYSAFIAYGSYAGDVLPTATIFRLVSVFNLSTIEFYMPYAILVFAGLGTVFAWLASLRLVPATPLRRTEIALMRTWRWWGLPTVLSLFLFSLSAGGWSGHIRTTDLNYMSLAGLAPNSDALGYFTDTFHQDFWGRWDQAGSRRPVAEAFRQVTVFAAQYSYVDTLLIQLGLLALVTFLAAYAIARWRGIWAALGFIGLNVILVRPFLATTLTEPLALIWAMFSLIYLIEALRLNSLAHALLGFAGLVVALLTRMGSLFTIPFLVLWMLVVFAKHKRERVMVFALACGVLLTVGAVSLLLSYLYGSPRVLTGGNFAWTLCGLSMGANWSVCDQAYALQFVQFSSEKDVVWFLLGKAWRNFLLNPTVFLQALYINMGSFFEVLPRFLLSGYTGYSHRPENYGWPSVLMLLPGLIYVFGWRTSFRERLLWIALAVSIPISAAVVLADDGWRVLFATHGLIICFFALGFTAPGVVVIPDDMARAWSWQTGAAMAVAGIALFVAIPELSRVLAIRDVAAHPPLEQPNNNNEQQIVLGGRRITGFLVISDAELRPFTVPAIHLSQFIELVRLARLEDDFGPFLRDVVARTPFAIVVGGRLDAENQSNIYVAPPEVLEQRDAWAWRFTLRVRIPSKSSWRILQEAIAVHKLP